MCIIILNKGGTLPDKHLHQARKANKDGAGLMYAVQGEIKIFKSMNGNNVIAEYKRIRKLRPLMPIALHFRIATDGDVNGDNCHPYTIGENMAIMHNGILFNYANRNHAMSDTRLFIEDILKHIPKALLYTEPIRKLVQQAIGNNNKLLFLTTDGQFMLVNEGAGIWDDRKQNWFSNNSYKPAKRSYFHKGLFDDSWLTARHTSRSGLDKCDVCGIYDLNVVDGLCPYCRLNCD